MQCRAELALLKKECECGLLCFVTSKEAFFATINLRAEEGNRRDEGFCVKLKLTFSPLSSTEFEELCRDFASKGSLSSGHLTF